MSRIRSFRPVMAAAAMAAAVVSLGACASGVGAQTTKMKPHSAAGEGAVVGDMAVRNVYFVADGGSGSSSSGYLVATVANTSESGTDSLRGVTVNGVAAQATGGASASPAPSSASSGGSAGFGSQIGSLSAVRFGDPTAGEQGQALRVTGLSQPVREGDTVEVVFSFEHAGSVTLVVPVTPTHGTTATATPIPSVSLETTSGGHEAPLPSASE